MPFAVTEEASYDDGGEAYILAYKLQQSPRIVNGRVARHPPTDGGEDVHLRGNEFVLGVRVTTYDEEHVDPQHHGLVDLDTR